MSHWSTTYFEYFDIHSAESLRDHGLAYIEDRVLIRAKKILRKRSKSEISEIVRIVDAICERYFDSDKVFERILKEAELFDHGELPVISRMEKNNRDSYGSTVAEYLGLMSVYKLEDVSDEVQPGWCEVFALLALNTVAEAAADDVYQLSRNLDGGYRKDFARLDCAAYFLFEALELINLAEKIESSLLSPPSVIENEAGKQLSIRNTMAAKKKHEPIRRLKDKFIKYYYDQLTQSTVNSKSDAAKKFYALLPPSEKRLLAPTNAERTLKDALREYEKLRS